MYFSSAKEATSAEQVEVSIKDDDAPPRYNKYGALNDDGPSHSQIPIAGAKGEEMNF